MSYDKEQAQLKLRPAPATHRGHPVVAQSLFEGTGEVLVTYLDPEMGYLTGPLGGGPMANADALADALEEVGVTDGVPSVGKEFKHFKGGFYTVTAVSLHEATAELLVTYHSVMRGTDWTRTFADFSSSVPRFALVPPKEGDG